jgi:hypothetical protein
MCLAGLFMVFIMNRLDDYVENWDKEWLAEFKEKRERSAKEEKDN